MKKPQFYECEMYFPVFSNFRVTVVISKELGETYYFIANREGWTTNKNHETSDAFTISLLSKGQSFVFLKPDTEIGTIAHESFHATAALLDFIHSSGKDDEMTAYHLDWIVNKAVEFNLLVADRFKETK